MGKIEDSNQRPPSLKPCTVFTTDDACCTHVKLVCVKEENLQINSLPHMPILGSSNSAAHKDMMSNIWTNGDTII